MIFIKLVMLGVILILSTYVGILVSNRYKNRVVELKEMKKALQLFETKIKFTYEPIPDIFLEISKNTNENISNIFKVATGKMNKVSAGIAWKEALGECKCNLEQEDLEVIKGLSKLLGQTDIDGQISQIKLTDTFIDEQIDKAEKEYIKNEKLYKTLRCCFRISNCNSTNLMCL